LLTFTDEGSAARSSARLANGPTGGCETFSDPEKDVRVQRQRILENPFISHRGNVRGFVFDVTSGRLSEVR